MKGKTAPEQLGLELCLQHPDAEDLERIPESRDERNNILYPEVDADQDHVHFEMVPMLGESILWLTIRRGTAPPLVSSSLRKIANLIDRHGENVMNLLRGDEGSFGSDGELVQCPLQLGYNEHGDLVFPTDAI